MELIGVQAVTFCGSHYMETLQMHTLPRLEVISFRDSPLCDQREDSIESCEQT